MATVTRAEVALSAKNNLRPGLQASARELERFKRMVDQSTARMRGLERLGELGNVVRGATASLAALATTGALVQTTRRFADVDRSMSRIGITGDATIEATRAGALELRDLAQDVALPFDRLREGLDQITASGREFGDALRMMPAVARTAQASGATVADIANSSTALIDHMKISIEGLQQAQDTLAMGGQLGKFELKDMARYLPSMLPAFRALGYEGQEGLRRLVATLQVIRAGTGTAEEAAASANNIFQKMESDQTVKNFKEMGVDLPKALAKARKEGRDLIQVFTELTQKALKGDMSKLPQLFQDMELARGMRAMLAGVEKRAEILGKLADSQGTIARNVTRITTDAQASLDRMSEASDRAATAIGRLVAQIAQPAVEKGADNMNDVAKAIERAADAHQRLGFLGAMREDLEQNVIPFARQAIAEGRDMIQRAQDEAILSRMEARRTRHAGQHDGAIASLDAEITRLENVRGGNPAAQAERSRLIARKRAERDERARANAGQFEMTPDEAAAFSRDQLRRSGAGVSFTPPVVDPKLVEALVDDAREARKARGFSDATGQALPRGRSVTAPLPPTRPTDPAIIPTQGFDMAVEKAGEVKAAVAEIGPAGQMAGSQIAAGINSQLDAALSKIVRIKQELASLRAPSLGFGGMPTGKLMGEVR